jgi:hypothetical protein
MCAGKMGCYGRGLAVLLISVFLSGRTEVLSSRAEPKERGGAAHSIPSLQGTEPCVLVEKKEAASVGR